MKQSDRVTITIANSCTLHKIAVVMQGLVYVFFLFVSGPEATRLCPYYYTNCRGFKTSTI